MAPAPEGAFAEFARVVSAPAPGQVAWTPLTLPRPDGVLRLDADGGRLEFAVVRHAVQELIRLTEKLLGGWPFWRGAGEGLGRWVRRHEKMGEQPMDFGAERGGGVFLAG